MSFVEKCNLRTSTVLYDDSTTQRTQNTFLKFLCHETSQNVNEMRIIGIRWRNVLKSLSIQGPCTLKRYVVKYFLIVVILSVMVIKLWFLVWSIQPTLYSKQKSKWHKWTNFKVYVLKFYKFLRCLLEILQELH